MRAFGGLAAIFLLAVGCGGVAHPSYTVGGQTLIVQDSGYLTSDANAFCDIAPPGQLRLVLVDYAPICGPNIGIDADGGARNPQLAHNELELIFITSQVTMPKMPYTVGVADCVNGPTQDGIANFYHYPANSDTPVVTVATGGEMFLTYLDPTGKKPATGSFTLDFGSQGSIEGNFSTYTCN